MMLFRNFVFGLQIVILSGIVEARPNWKYDKDKHDLFFEEETLSPVFKFMMVLLLTSLKLNEGIMLASRLAQAFSKLSIPKLLQENNTVLDYFSIFFRYIELLILFLNEIMVFGIVYFTIEASQYLVYESTDMKEAVGNFVALIIISELDEYFGPIFLKLMQFFTTFSYEDVSTMLKDHYNRQLNEEDEKFIYSPSVAKIVTRLVFYLITLVIGFQVALVFRNSYFGFYNV